MKTHVSQSKQTITYTHATGFTVIELLLYVGISSVILLITSLLLSLLLQSRIKNQTVAEVEQQGIQVMQFMTQAIRNAEGVNEPTIGLSDTELSLDVLEAVDDPTIFDLSDNQIRMMRGATTPIALTNSRVIASDFTVENLSRSDTSGTIRISFVLTHVNPEGRNEYNFSKIFYTTATVRYL